MILGTVYRNLYEQSVYCTPEYDPYNTMLLSEAYYGKHKVKPIQDAMDAIAKHCWEDHNWKVQGSKEAENLENAFRKVFGFKRCSIYWRYTNPALLNQLTGTSFNQGTCTTPSMVLIPDTSAKSPDKYGTAKTGFYDSSHTICCSIMCDQAYFSPFIGLSSEEAVGVILHEVGHNFDNTSFKLIHSWYQISRQILNLAEVAKATDYDPAKIGMAAATNTITVAAEVGLLKVAPEYFAIINNIDDIVVTQIPPFAQVYKAISNLAGGAMAITNTIMAPIGVFRIITSLPKRLLTIPITKALDMFTHWFFTNKSETYADSFAAQYGYGVEVNTGLRKLVRGMTGEFEFLKKTPVDVALRPFWDIMYLYANIASAIDGHGDFTERWKRALATLDQDLAESGLNAADKKLILAEKARVQKEYDKFMKLDAERKMFATALYNKIAACWYRGDSHGFVKTVFTDKTYAQ